MYTIYQAQQRQREIKNVLFDTATTMYTTQYYQW